MANHKSAKKRAKQTIERRMRNKVKKTTMRTLTKKVRAAIEVKDKTVATTLLPKLHSLLGKMAKTNTVTNKEASRRVSRLASQINTI